jgi:hypothetical protein
MTKEKHLSKNLQLMPSDMGLRIETFQTLASPPHLLRTQTRKMKLPKALRQRLKFRPLSRNPGQAEEYGEEVTRPAGRLFWGLKEHSSQGLV